MSKSLPFAFLVTNECTSNLPIVSLRVLSFSLPSHDLGMACRSKNTKHKSLAARGNLFLTSLKDSIKAITT